MTGAQPISGTRTCIVCFNEVAVVVVSRLVRQAEGMTTFMRAAFGDILWAVRPEPVAK